MSFLIDRLEQLIQSRKFSKAAQYKLPGSCSFWRDTERRGQEIALQRVLSCMNSQSLVISSTNQILMASFYITLLYRNLYLILIATIDRQSLHLKLSFRLVNGDQSYMVVSSSQRRLNAAKNIFNFNKARPDFFNQYKISIQINSGLVKIQNPIFYHLKKQFEPLPFILNFYAKNFSHNLTNLNEPLLQIIEVTNANPINLNLPKIKSKQKKVENYVKIMHVLLNLGTEQTNQERSLNKKILLEQESINSLNDNLVPICHIVKSNQLYRPDDSLRNKDHTETELSLSEKQKKEIKDKLDIPQIASMQEGNQRNWVVNRIKLKSNLQGEPTKRIDRGGFSNIFLYTDVYYYQINSHSLQKANNLQFQLKNPQKKAFIVKKEIKKQAQKRNRLQHQKYILENLKNALAVFTPKYYFIMNQQKEYSDMLFMEHIYLHNQTYNLQDYAKKFKLSLSQFTVVFFAYMISQGLRYLKDFSIVHLDIKLSNIMIGKRLAVKIIDFGESYHPSLYNHSPGVSMPYSPPQCYAKQTIFNSKSDVYSFGILLYNLLFSKHPFYLFSEKQREIVFSQGSITDRWFFTPEDLCYYGDITLFPFLQLLIGKCLHPDPKCRPELEWISLILRECLEYVI